MCKKGTGWEWGVQKRNRLYREQFKKGTGWEKVKMGRKVLKLNYGGDMVNGDVNGEEDMEVLREFVIVLK